jgi:ABC-type branched-subunit amino acid transport system permease subunit
VPVVGLLWVVVAVGGKGVLSGGVAGEVVVAFVDRAVVGAAHQDQVVEVGRAAVEPVPQVVRVMPMSA